MGRISKMTQDIMKVNLDLGDVLLHEFMLDKKTPLIDKIRIIAPLIAKRIPTNVNLGGQPNNPLGISLNIVLQSDDKKELPNLQ